ncbi:G2/mitotic-specific cyclin-B3 [Aphelenchoides besseyi]|nr:G2/mitotic-specific cyclin-B3 [Aphelenchoides besseyi]
MLEFHADIIRYAKNRESRFAIRNYLSGRDKSALTKERAQVVDWMSDLCDDWELTHDVLYLAVRIMDLYYSKGKDTDFSMMSYVACSSLFISSKFDSRSPPYIREFVEESLHKPCSANLLRAYERLILVQLGFDINAPTAYDFLRIFGSKNRVELKVITRARFYLELSLFFLDFCKLSESKLASAALLLALRTSETGNWNSALTMVTGYSLGDVEPLMFDLNHMVHRFGRVFTMNWKVIEKYTDVAFFKVAKMPLLPDLLPVTAPVKPRVIEVINTLDETSEPPRKRRREALGVRQNSNAHHFNR